MDTSRSSISLSTRPSPCACATIGTKPIDKPIDAARDHAPGARARPADRRGFRRAGRGRARPRALQSNARRASRRSCSTSIGSGSPRRASDAANAPARTMSPHLICDAEQRGVAFDDHSWSSRARCARASGALRRAALPTAPAARPLRAASRPRAPPLRAAPRRGPPRSGRRQFPETARGSARR